MTRNKPVYNRLLPLLLLLLWRSDVGHHTEAFQIIKFLLYFPPNFTILALLFFSVSSCLASVFYFIFLLSFLFQQGYIPVTSGLDISLKIWKNSQHLLSIISLSPTRHLYIASLCKSNSAKPGERKTRYSLDV